MNYLAKFFIENYKFTVVLSLFVVFFGLSGVLGIKSESFPSVNLGAVVITTRYDGATAEDIETKITRKIEDEIQKVSGLKKVKSTSQAGLSTIVTEVDIDRYDVKTVIADLQRAVDRTTGLPQDLLQKPVFTEIKSDEFPVIEVAVVGSNENRQRDSAADALREDVKDNKKVASTTLTGYRERQFNIQINKRALQDLHVSIGEIQRALAQRNVSIPAGELKNADSQKILKIDGKATSKEEIENIVVRSNFSQERILLKQVAKVSDEAEDPITLASHNGAPATFLTITKKGGVDLLDLAKEVEVIVSRYNEKYKGTLQFQIFNNEGVRVGDRLDILVSNGWQGILLVIIFLLIFLPGKVGLVSSLSLPLALFATLGFVSVIGYTLNTITIIALIIAIGMLVDNAVVVSENYTRLRDEGMESQEALLKTVRELWAPVTATALTTIAAFLPMLVTTGVMGQFIKAIPIVVTASLILSLLESFFLLPMRLKLVGYKPKKQGDLVKKDWFDSKIVPVFEKQVRWLVANKWKSFGLYILLMVGTILLMAFGNKVNLFPTDQTEIYLVRVEAPKGTRIEKTQEWMEIFASKIKVALDGKASHVAATAGSSYTDNSDPKGESGSNVGLIRIFVNKETQNNVPTQNVLETLRELSPDPFKRVTYEALANGPPVGAPITVILRSNNMTELDAVATHLRDFSAKIPGVFDAKVDDVYGDDEILIDVNYAQAARFGLTLQEIGAEVRTAVAGQKIGDVNLNNKEVDYFLRFTDSDKADMNTLSSLKISDRLGNLIPLKNMAEFELRPGSAQIKRYDFKRAKTVTADIDDTVVTSIQANKLIADEFARIQNKYKDVNLVFGGEAENTNESVASLMNALVLSTIGIFALLVLMFRSYLNPMLILSTIPLGLVGIAVAFFVHQKALSFLALIGIIGLAGIIVNSGIILISFIDQLKSETKMSIEEIVVKAATLRLRSVLVTSLTTISGLVPTAYGIGGADYFIIPMALALAWGLSTGTLFTLYWIPPAYLLLQESIEKLRLFFKVMANRVLRGGAKVEPIMEVKNG